MFVIIYLWSRRYDSMTAIKVGVCLTVALERVVNCGCRSDELESQTEPVVRRGRRIVTTSKITDWVGDGNSFGGEWEIVDGFADWKQPKKKQNGKLGGGRRLTDAARISLFLYIYFRCGWCERNQVRRSELWLTPLAGSTWLYRKKDTLYRLFRTHILRTQRALAQYITAFRRML